MELGISARDLKKYNDEATGPIKKSDDISIRLDTIHERVGQTDGHRATAKTALTHSVVR